MEDKSGLPFNSSFHQASSRSSSVRIASTDVTKDLRISTATQADSNVLQAFVRESKVPFLSFSADPELPPDTGNSKRFDSLLEGLSKKGNVSSLVLAKGYKGMKLTIQVAVVHLDSSEKGVILCTAPGMTGNGRPAKLLGLLCIVSFEILSI